jgi:integrase
MAGLTIKKPDDKRRSYSVHIKENINGEVKYIKLEDERLDSINSALKSGLFNREDAEIRFNVFINDWKKDREVNESAKIRAITNIQNQKLFDEYWNTVYKKKKMLSKDTAYSQFIFALKSIDNHSIISTSNDDLQKCVDKVFNEIQHRRYVGRINSLLNHIGRIKLQTYQVPHREISHVTIKEFNKIIAFVKDPVLASLYGTLFGTGVRLGEAFKLNEGMLSSNGSIYISMQLTRDFSTRQRKNKKNYRTILLREFKDSFKRWSDVENKNEYRNNCSHYLTFAAKKAFPKDKSKHISPHDLRHSYVIEMLSRGVPLDKCANLIGDSLKATEEHYAGFVIRDVEIDMVNRIIGQGK